MIYPLSEGTYTVDVTKNFIPFDAAVDQLKDRPASLVVDIVPFLVQTKNNLIVIDPGLGLESKLGEFMIYENIKRCGFDVDDVSMVLLSHLHKDHTSGVCYGSNQSFNLMFPSAKYYCQQKEMEYAYTKKNSSSFDFLKLDFLKHSTRLHYLNGNGIIGNEINYSVSGGHTPYHQVFHIQQQEHNYFYGGDVLPQASQIIRRFVAKYDFDGKKSEQLRKEWAHSGALEKWTFLFFHDAKTPMGKATELNNQFSITKVV